MVALPVARVVARKAFTNAGRAVTEPPVGARFTFGGPLDARVRSIIVLADSLPISLDIEVDQLAICIQRGQRAYCEISEQLNRWRGSRGTNLCSSPSGSSRRP